MLFSRSLLKQVDKYASLPDGTIIYRDHNYEKGPRAVIGASYILTNSLKQLDRTIAALDNSLLYQLRQKEEIAGRMAVMLKTMKEGMR